METNTSSFRSPSFATGPSGLIANTRNPKGLPSRDSGVTRTHLESAWRLRKASSSVWRSIS